MSEYELKPCPFCGATPNLPSGQGTQYEIDCDDCGCASASVQIADYMTIEERMFDGFVNWFYERQYIERAKTEALLLWNRRTP